MKTSGKVEKALKLFNTNKLTEARNLLNRICRTDSQNMDAWKLLGMTEARLGRFEKTEQCFRRILRFAPDSADTHYYLAAALQSQHLYSEAIREFEVTLSIQPDYIKASYSLGNIYVGQGFLEKAEVCFRDALRYNPKYFEALNNLGSVLKTSLKLEQALECFLLALAIKTGDAGILCNLGNTYHLLEKYDQAESYYRESISAGEATAEAYCGLSGVFYKQGKMNEAQLLLEEAMQIMPADDSIVASQAAMYEADGQYDQAYAIVKDKLDNHCESVDIIATFAKFAGRIKLADKAVGLLHHLLEQNLDTAEKMQLSFLLGKLYDDTAKYDEAYHYFSTANQLKPLRLDKDELLAKVDGLISVFSSNMLSAEHGTDRASQKPVFVVGMPRSGTSLVEQILSSHPDIFGAGELIDVGMYVASMKTHIDTKENYPSCVTSMTPDSFTEFSDRYLKTIDALAPDAACVIDKMPGNFMHLGFIQLMFPGARIIHCTRYPLDNCLSCYFMDFLGYHPYAYDQASLGFYYCQYQRLMKHWQDVINLPIYTVQYENLVNNQEKISRELVEFCGLQWNQSCLNFHQTKRLVKTASYDQVRRPIYKNAIGRAEPYRSRLGALIRALESCCDNKGLKNVEKN